MSQTIDESFSSAAEDMIVFPMSFAQQRMWFLDQLQPGNVAFNVAETFRLRGPLDVRAFGAAVQGLVDRHEILRTCFGEVDGEPSQLVAPELCLDLVVHDLTNEAADRREAEGRRLLTRAVQRPFDLAQLPLLRVELVRVAEQEHLFAFVAHHIVFDGWSWSVLARDLAALYRANLRGEESNLPDLIVQYGDYAVWQREWLSGATLDAQLSYWKGVLKDLPSPLELPKLKSAAASESEFGKGAQSPVKFGPDLSAAVQALGRGERATPFMTMLAAFAVLLYRYTGQTDIVIGAPIANRTRQETQDLIGCMINPLPIRVDLSRSPSFREMLGRVRTACLGALAHQDTPFDELVRVLNLKRDLRTPPLFQVLFQFQDFFFQGMELPDLTVEQILPELGYLPYPVALEMGRNGGDIEGWVEFVDEHAHLMRRLPGHLSTLLAAVVADPDRTIDELPLLTADEHQCLLEEWNDTHVDFLPARGVEELFEATARRTPDTLAIKYQDDTLTYRELDTRANQLAHHLRGLGVAAGVRVGVLVERSVAMVVGIVGVLKAGGTYVPLDPRHPLQRLEFIRDDAEFPVLLTDDAVSRIVPLQGVTRVRLDTEWPEIATCPQTPPPPTAGATEPAYIIYTSGTTGQPKGVVVERGSLVNAYYGWERAYRLREETHVHLQMANVAFDVFSGDLARALGSGATLVIAPHDLLLEPQRLYELMVRERVDCAEFVPVVLRGLLNHLEQTGQRLDFMRLLAAGSDTWYVQEYRRALRLLGPRTRLINSYGLTEATIDSTWYEASMDELPAEGVVPIGRPFANVALYILDARRQPVPVSVVGELYVGGAGLSRGYLNRPELTADKFVPHPFRTDARLYRTGDRARYLPDGNVEFLGRADDQVKLRGHRIELGEIETLLGRHPGVSAAVAVVRHDERGEGRLVAYTVPPPGQPAPSAAELRQHLKGSLPEYMLPAAFVVLDRIPITSNGKVDRRALPAPEDGCDTVGADDYVAPRSPVEESVAQLAGEVLGVQRVGMGDDFFSLGGHSLLATRMVSRVRETFGIELPLRVMFESSVLSDLAAQVESRLGGSARPAPPRIERRPDPSAEAPLSFAQQRLYFLHRLEPDSDSYHLPGAARLRGRLDREALSRTFQHLAQRHESLRTTFRERDGEVVQVVHPEVTLPFQTIDLRHLPSEQREVRAEKCARELGAQPFRLTDELSWRAALIVIDEHDHVLSLTLHHVVTDGWSMGVLMREIAAIYAAEAQGTRPNLDVLPVQYVDYAVWQREWLQGGVLAEQLAYWTRKLAGPVPALELPADRPRPARPTHAAGRVRRTIPADLVAALDELTRMHGATRFMVLMAAVQVLMHRHSGQTDFAIGSPVANRNRGETEGLIGFFVNTLVYRADLTGEPTFAQLLGRVRETALEAYAAQDVPFERLVSELRLERDLSRPPLFQVLFSLQQQFVGKVELPGVTLEPLEFTLSSTKFDLTISVVERGDELLANFEYSAELFDAETMRRMTDRFEWLLRSIVQEPNAPVSRLAMLPPDERRMLLETWNDTARPGWDLEDPVHRRIERQAATTPDRVAVEFDGRELTYAALDRQANRLANRLRGIGVGPDVIVAVLLERSLEMAPSVLGVLKAGGAYLPMDANYPPERLAYMLQDSRCAVLLTQERLAERLAGFQGTVICVDAKGEFANESDDPPALVETRGEHLSYVIYTSGSTGRPKGAMNTHRGLVNRMLGLQEQFGLAADDRVLHKTPFGFDVAVLELIWPLCFGARIVVARPGGHQDSRYLVQLIRDRQVTTTHFVPSMLRVFLEEPGVTECRSLRRVLSGGEALSADLKDLFLSRLQAELHNQYGPAETAIEVTCHTVQRDAHAQVVPIGRPVPNVQLYVLDGERQPVPVGVPGELYVGGVQVGRGYLHRPDLTAERFVADPFRDQPGALLYRTGDLARWREDGSLEFLGRLDAQVKIRGNRVELGEIEAALRQHADIQEAVVVASGDGAAKRLVAYLVCNDRAATPPGVSELRQSIGKTLPDYMVPAAFVVLEAMPISPNGKLDRAALPDPDDARPDREKQYVPPRNVAERTLAEIWSQLLRVEHVGVHDNFFELGGDSILGIQIVSRANRAGLALSVRDLFEHQTIAELAAAAGSAANEQHDQTPVVGPSPLLPIQAWFLDADPVDAHHFNQSVMLQASRALEAEPLRQALRALMHHHDALRLRLHRSANGVRQEIAPCEDDVALWEVDLRDVAPDGLASAIGAHAARAQTSLDLERGPLVRAVWFRTPAQQPQRLLLVIHHLAVDAVSWRILLEDFQQAYRQGCGGQRVNLSPKSASVQAWGCWLHEHAQSEALVGEGELWLDLLPDSAPAIPRDRVGDQANTNSLADDVFVSLDEAQTRRLTTDAVKTYNARIQELLLTALAVAWHRWTGGRQLFLDIEGHGRDVGLARLDISRTVGWFTSLYPLALSWIDGRPRQVLDVVREQLRRVPHGGVGYGLLRYLRDDDIARRIRTRPQPEVGFNYLGQFDQMLDQSALFSHAPESPGPNRSPRSARRHLIDINASVLDGRLNVALTYSTAVHDRENIERLGQAYIDVIHSMLHEIDRTAIGIETSALQMAGLDDDDVGKLLSILQQQSDQPSTADPSQT